jgi:hypothetical protein
MEGFYGLLAHHLKECGKTKEASISITNFSLIENQVDYYEKAAEGAFNVFARNEAIDLYQQALDLDSHMPDYPGF